MFKPPETTFFFDADSNQCPEVMLRMHGPDMIKLIEGLCMTMVINFTSQEDEDEDHPLGSQSHYLQSALPLSVVNNVKVRTPIDAHRVSHCWFQVEMVMRFAAMLDRIGHDYLVGMEHHTRPLIYATLHQMHEYRVQDLRRSIRMHGPQFGCATNWFRYRYDTVVKSWPDRYNFLAFNWTPLPGEDIDEYANDVSIWNSKQSNNMEN